MFDSATTFYSGFWNKSAARDPLSAIHGWGLPPDDLFLPDAPREAPRPTRRVMGMVGLALPYGVPSWVKDRHDFEPAQGWRLQMYFEPGAFAFSVQRVNEGKSDLPLIVEHNSSRQLATTGAGSLSLFEEADGLHFVASKGSVPDEFTGYQCSAGFGVARWEVNPLSGGVALVRIFAAVLTEITLTQCPAFPSTWTRMLRG